LGGYYLNFDKTKKYPTLLYCQVDHNRHWRNLLLPMEFTVDGC
jgi:hypothetical protein